MLAKSPEFVLYVEAKLLNKLQSLAKFAKGASDLTRGKVLGRQASTEESGLFLSMLVCAIKMWGTTFQKYEHINRLSAESRSDDLVSNGSNKDIAGSKSRGDGQNLTEFNAVYSQLSKENIPFVTCPELFKLVA